MRKMAPRGSGHITDGGYVRMYVPGHREASKAGFALQHRIVVSDALDRKLFEDETVHHKNGITTDNRLENLELWAGLHPKGQRVEDLLDWANTIIDRYGDHS